MFIPYQKLGLFLLQYRYFFFFPAVMIEGPITTVVAGFLSSLGYFNFTLTYFLAVIADLTSDMGYYALGRWGRKRFIERYGHYVGITQQRIERLEGLVRRHGGKMLIFGKIADPLSSTMQTIAGITKMRFSAYLFYNIISTFPKSFLLITIGYYFGEALHAVNFYEKTIGIIASVVGIIILTAYYMYRKREQRKLEGYEPPTA